MWRQLQMRSAAEASLLEPLPPNIKILEADSKAPGNNGYLLCLPALPTI